MLHIASKLPLYEVCLIKMTVQERKKQKKKKIHQCTFSRVFTFLLLLFSWASGHFIFFVLSSFLVLPLFGGGYFFFRCWSFRQGHHPYRLHIDMQRQLSTPLTFFFFVCRVISFIILKIMSLLGFTQQKKN